ncbi:MAG: CDP-glycerol glycerophosphotransferase family protein [Clostridia bacterium]|nr:CDP-glycerol glycerophosphotransferase family protein [Clostridia bacterium]
MKKLKKNVMGIIGRLASPLVKRSCILFESAPAFTDNAMAVYDEFVRRGFDRDKLIWVLDDGFAGTAPAGVKYVYRTERLKFLMLLLKAQCVVCSNRIVSSPNPKTVNAYLGHGTTIKKFTTYYHLPDTFTDVLAASEFSAQLHSRVYQIDRSKIFICGYPRNDVLTSFRTDLHPFFAQPYRKVIVWYPTFRQHKNGSHYTDCEHPIPLIWDERSAREINRCAQENQVLIAVKPHPAQDVSVIHEMKLSNILFIDDAFIDGTGLNSYQFIASCDALLTDYSSVYYDYTLVDKPIGLVWDDFRTYAEHPGFAVDMDTVMRGGEKIYDVPDMVRFIADVARGVDNLRDERREVCQLANAFQDGRNAERTVDYLMARIQQMAT